MQRRARQDPSKNLVGFVVGEVRYAVPIEAVREIVNPLPTVELPGSASDVVGVADYRDEVVPVVDLRKRFGLVAQAMTRRTKWIVLDASFAKMSQLGFQQTSGALVAIVVDGVTEVFRSDDSALRPAPATGATDARRGIAGVATFEGELVFVLDVARVVEVEAERQLPGGGP
jgi:purine-binding chemotaxis protein CheW